jgi:transcriptional regulator with XRE-family HTH domain
MNKIKEIRKLRGITQKELTAILNVQRQTLSRYETGAIPLTDETIVILARHFGVTSDYLLGISNEGGGLAKQKPEEKYACLTDEETTLIKALRRVDPDGINGVADILTDYVSAVNSSIEKLIKRAKGG